MSVFSRDCVGGTASGYRAEMIAKERLGTGPVLRSLAEHEKSLDAAELDRLHDQAGRQIQELEELRMTAANRVFRQSP